MGKSNRDRRAAKKRKDQRRYARSRSGESCGWAAATVGADLRYMMIMAATICGPDRPNGSEEEMWAPLLAVAGKRGSGGSALVVDEVFCDCLGDVFEAGWQPAEAVRIVRRRLGGRHADLTRTAVAAVHSTMKGKPPEPWATQLRELDAAESWWGRGRDWLGPWALRNGLAWSEALKTAVEALAVLMRLPVTEILSPPPSQWRFSPQGNPASGAPVEDAILAKVRALLAKAESTSFQHESDALTAKAQELMTRHAIDAAIAHAGEGGTRERPTARRVPVDDPYAKAKSTLLGVAAAANQVRAVWDDEHALMTLIGFESDLDAVDVLFTSLLMQASRSMLAKGKVRDGRGRSRTRSFRQSFYVAFAQRVHERLEMAARAARASAEQEIGHSLLPVLAGRRDEVDDVTERMFPHLTKGKRASVTNPDGWRAGRVAGEMATLGPYRQRLDSTAG